MKVIQYLATSVNGHITIGQDESNWVTPDTIKDFEKLNIECGVVVMGRRTYECFGKDFPQPDCLNIVLTKDRELIKKQIDGALFTDRGPQEVIQIAQEKGFKQLFIVGGTQTSTSFLKANLIDEIWVNIHPIIIGHGKYLFDEVSEISIVNLELYESKSFGNGQVLLKYKFIK